MQASWGVVMKRFFVIGDEIGHVVGDAECAQCPEDYPEPCPCGGLIHGALGEEDPGQAEWPATRCDRCGRAEDTIE